jgi:hypothetical protein
MFDRTQRCALETLLNVLASKIEGDHRDSGRTGPSYHASEIRDFAVRVATGETISDNLDGRSSDLGCMIGCEIDRIRGMDPYRRRDTSHASPTVFDAALF